MRLIAFTICLLVVSSTAWAGDYGTISATYASRDDAFSAGAGGRFNFDNPAPTFNPAYSDYSLSPSIVDGRLYSFCIELGENIGSFSNADMNFLTNAPQDAGPGPNGETMTVQQAAALEVLADNYFVSAISAGEVAPVLGGSDKYQAGSFQLAVWNLVFSDGTGGFDLFTGTGGTYSYNPAAVTTYGFLDGSYLTGARTLLSKIFSTWQDVAGTTAIAIVDADPTRQDQLVLASVPEASSLLAFASVAGAIGLVMYRRRK